jgi:segregation and condensation protein B
MADHGREFKAVLEALIFAADAPLSLRRLVDLLPELGAQELGELLLELERDYAVDGRGLLLEEVGGGWRFATRAEISPYVERLLRGRRAPRLSQAALETLAIVVYRQPTTKAEIEAIRGVSVDGPLRTLLERELLKVTGRAAGPGRPLLYATTRELLVLLGIRDLRDLPQLDELESVLEAFEGTDPAQLELGQAVEPRAEESTAEESAVAATTVEAESGDNAQESLESGDDAQETGQPERAGGGAPAAGAGTREDAQDPAAGVDRDRGDPPQSLPGDGRGGLAPEV